MVEARGRDDSRKESQTRKPDGLPKLTQPRKQTLLQSFQKRKALPTESTPVKLISESWSGGQELEDKLVVIYCGELNENGSP